MELKANDLRIGNLLYYDNEVKETCSIHSDNTIRFKDKEKGSIGCFSVKTPLIKPIPLTEEWHNKFGVYKNGFNSFEYEIEDIFSFGIKIVFTEDYVFLRQGNKNNMHEDDIVSIWNKDLTKRHMYVHEFQNLYFALTNEELTIKM